MAIPSPGSFDRNRNREDFVLRLIYSIYQIKTKKVKQIMIEM